MNEWVAEYDAKIQMTGRGSQSEEREGIGVARVRKPTATRRGIAEAKAYPPRKDIEGDAQ